MSISGPYSTTADKRLLRRSMKLLRAEAFAKHPNAAHDLCSIFLKNIDLPPHGVIASYYPHQDEINPTILADALRARGYQIALPVLAGKGLPLIFRLYQPSDALRPGFGGIPEPTAAATEVEPDILLVPMLAFDAQLHRLGYGGGYYDRTLHQLRQRKKITAIGIAFADQQVPQIPVNGYDAPLDKIATNIQTF